MKRSIDLHIYTFTQFRIILLAFTIYSEIVGESRWTSVLQIKTNYNTNCSEQSFIRLKCRNFQLRWLIAMAKDKHKCAAAHNIRQPIKHIQRKSLSLIMIFMRKKVPFSNRISTELQLMLHWRIDGCQIIWIEKMISAWNCVDWLNEIDNCYFLVSHLFSHFDRYLGTWEKLVKSSRHRKKHPFSQLPEPLTT